MLVLTRKASQSIHIGQNVVVKVIRTGRSTVKIGIEAPAGVRVLRAELVEQPAEPASVGSEAADDSEPPEEDLPRPVAEAATRHKPPGCLECA